MNELKKITVRVPKEHSSFLYFTLESNEGLCFYSTLEGSKIDHFRDVEINIPKDFVEDVQKILDKLSQKFSIDYL